MLNKTTIVAIAIGTTACATAGFKRPVADFEAGISKTAEAVSVYYAELNSFERELYLQERALNPTLTVATQSGGKPTALAGQTFSADSIKVRTDAIKLLGVHGKRLAALAGSDAPSDVAAGIKALGESFSGLATSFSSLTETDASATKYVSPVTSLVGLVTQSILEARRDKLLTEAVTNGAPATRTIISLLEKDLDEIVGPQRLTGTKQALVELIRDYNRRKSEMSVDDRRAALDEIRKAQERYEVAVVFSPSELFRALSDAHEALVTYASSHRRNPDAAELAAKLDVFRERAEAAAKEIARLRELKRGAA